MKQRILLVEDEMDISKVTRTRLEHAGYEVVVQSSAEEAMEWIRAGGHPDLLLLDVKLPDMDGLDFCKWFRSRPKTARVPVVVVTALTGDWKKITNRCAELGVAASLKKPFESSELLEVVRTAIERKGAVHG